MSTRILVLFIVSLGTLLFAGKPQSKEQPNMITVRVRYMVNDLDPAVEFYTKHLGFGIKQERRPNFAILSRGNLELVLSTPFGPGGAAKPMPDGRKPEPGGWNRIIINVDNLEAEVTRLRKAQLHFRNDIVSGPGGSEILLDDPPAIRWNCSSPRARLLSCRAPHSSWPTHLHSALEQAVCNFSNTTAGAFFLV